MRVSHVFADIEMALMMLTLYDWWGMIFHFLTKQTKPRFYEDASASLGSTQIVEHLCKKQYLEKQNTFCVKILHPSRKLVHFFCEYFAGVRSNTFRMTKK